MDNFVESLKLNYLLRYKDLDFEHSKQNFMRDNPILESFTEIRICQPDPEEDNAWNFVSTNSGTNDYNNSDTIKILIPVFKIQCAKPQIESFEINEELFISMILLVGGYL
ncbi:22365_t:CDS:1, partial [Gigaspora rosea]